VWTAKTLMDYFAAHPELAKPGLRVGWWPLGADFHPQCATPSSKQAVNLAANATPFFLSVGTLEMRKAHWVALRAFDRLWEAGVDVRYVVVGQQGGGSHALASSFKQHREYGKRLIWLDRANDADLLHYYRSARALIAPSIVEGFSLPIVEALQNRLPVIASDIAVFHEIGGASLNYFRPMDDESLAHHIAAALENRSIRPTARMISWRQSADCLIDLIRHERYQVSLFPNG
jgi:glycosyltransferase involved in cell wall biosynthesis